MKILDFGSKNFFKDLAEASEASLAPGQTREIAAAVIADVRKNGDAALERLTAKFDGAKLKAAQMRVSPAEFAAALKSVSPADKKAVREAVKCVKFFNAKSKPKNWRAKNPHGAVVGEIFYPIERVGLYIPGGNAPLVSTVVMTATLAKIAGCGQICVCTPPRPDGSVDAHILAALAILGVDEVYKLGGAQAIAAMGVGTATVKKVDKLFGPGNAFVIEAKRALFGEVGVDLLPGPSEVMIVADASANPTYVASDLLSQAEHGSGREKIFLVATSKKLAAAVQKRLGALAANLSRAEKLLEIIRRGCYVAVVPDMRAAAQVANFVAPEHMELHVENPEKWLPLFKTAGAILAGGLTPTVLGDFTAGPSHTLPTGRTGRFSGGLQVADFMRRSSFVKYGAKSLKKAAAVVGAFARMESLDAHGNSLNARLN